MKPLSDLLREHFGESFPVSSGSAKRDDPLIILDERDYVSIEYSVAQLLLDLAECEYELEQQHVRPANGRVVDELVYATSPKGAPEWTETRRFFFDITAGFKR